MKRVAAHLLAFASFAIFVAMLIAWARGGWADRWADRHLIGNWYYHTDGGSYQHLVQVILIHASATQAIGPQLGPDGIFTPACDAWQKRYAPRTQITSGSFSVDYDTMIGTNAQHRLVAGGERIGIELPFWAAIAVWAILPAVVWVIFPIHRRLRRQEAASRSMTPMIAPSESVFADQPCIHCGYNLRTLKVAGKCPECGAAIAETIGANSDLSQAPPQWLKKLAIANVLLFLSRLTLAATYAAIFQRNGGFVGEYSVAVLLAAMTLVLYLAGALMLTTGAHTIASRDSGQRSFRRLALISMAILASGATYQVVFTLTAPPEFGLMGSASVHWYWGSTELMLAGWILFCWCILKEFFLLAQMLLRIPNRLLATYCKTAGIGLAVSGLLMLHLVHDIIGQWSAFNTLEMFLATIWFIFLAWAGLLNFGLALRFMRLSRRQLQSQGASLMSAV